jgi:hypothetical protein
LPGWQGVQVLASPLGEKVPAGQEAAWLEESAVAVEAMALAPGTPSTASALARESVKARVGIKAASAARLALAEAGAVMLASTAMFRDALGLCSWRRLRL